MQARGYVTESYPSAEEFLDANPEDGSGCLVVDLKMPGMNGLELQERLRSSGRSTPVVFLTGHGDVPTSVRAMRGGAVNFLTKPVDETDLVDAVEEAFARADRVTDRERRARSFRARVPRLTKRQREVMHLVVAGRLNKQIADELGIAEKTVKVHRGKMMEVLAVASVAELVRLCVETGLCEPGDGATEVHD
jgi:FixJ family two-component response regulator